jgi:hypothetical protein
MTDNCGSVGRSGRAAHLTSIVGFLVVLTGCQHVVTNEQIQAKRVPVDQRCLAEAAQRRAAGDTAQVFDKVTACTNAGYRQGLLDLDYPYMDLADDWMMKRTLLARELDAGEAPISTAKDRYGALLAEFVANVKARNVERKETAQAACQILGAALVIATAVKGGTAFAECN